MKLNLTKLSGETKTDSTIKVMRERLNDTRGFKFDPKSHTYTLDGMRLISGTEIISRFVPEFDSAIISEMSAKKYRREGNEMLGDAKQVRRYWKMLGEHASSLGTAGHAFCLLYWLNRDIKPVTEIDRNAKKVMDAILHKYEILEMEVPRGNKRRGIGYTIDILMRDKISGEIVMGDFKFSSKFTNEQYKALKGKNANLLAEPFKAFRDIAHDKGSIQLELYSQLLEEDTGIHVDLKLLIHVDGLGYEEFYGGKGYKVYVINKCDEEVKSVLDTLIIKDDISELL